MEIIATLTRQGAAVLAAAHQGVRLTPTTIAAGCGAAVGDISEYTSLKSEIYRFFISKSGRAGADYWATAHIDSSGARADYELTEIGLYVADNAEPNNRSKDILYAVCVAASNTSFASIALEALFRYTVTIHAAVSPTADIHVNVIHEVQVVGEVSGWEVGDIRTTSYMMPEAPDSDYLLCDGSVIDIPSYPELMQRWDYPMKSNEGGDTAEIAWTLRMTDSGSSQIYAVCWSPELSLFVAGGFRSKQVLFYSSPDGKTWTLRNNATNDRYPRVQSVCWSPELCLFVAVGHANMESYGFICTSKDGMTWTEPKEIWAARFCSVCWSPELGLFATVGIQSGTNMISCYTSTDGINWISRPSISSGPSLYSVCWSKDKAMFVAVGIASASGYGTFYSSYDGVTWTSRQTNTESSVMCSVCWSPELSMFVAAGHTSGLLGVIYTSANGMSWTLRLKTTGTFTGYTVCWVPELYRFFAAGVRSVGSSASLGIYYTSTDGISWTEYMVGEDLDIQTICRSPELRLFVAVGKDVGLRGVFCSGLTEADESSAAYYLPDYNNSMPFTYLKVK